MKEMLTKAECSAMRGIAILAIMLHNFCHFNGKIVQENEYQFIDFNRTPQNCCLYICFLISDITGCLCSSSSVASDWSGNMRPLPASPKVSSFIII